MIKIKIEIREETNSNIENNIDIEIANIGNELNENYKKLMEGDINKEKVKKFMRKVRMAQTKYIELLKRNDSNYKSYY